jgi:hypothetical protein
VVERIADECGVTPYVQHRGPIKNGPLIEYEKSLDNYVSDKKRMWICDRWHLGEMVYGPMLRGVSKVTPAILQHIEMFLDARGALKLVVTAPLDEIQHRLSIRGEDLIPPRTIPFIWDWYNRQVRDLKDWRMVGWHEHAGKATINSIVKLSQFYQEDAAPLYPYLKWYIGPPAPRILVAMHDGREPPSMHSWAAPFKPYPATQNELLLGAFHDENIPYCYGFVNTDTPHLAAIIRTVQYEQLVALDSRSLDKLLEIRDTGTDPNLTFDYSPMLAGPKEAARIVKEYT